MRRMIWMLLAVALLVAGCGEEEQDSTRVATRVAPQLEYLDPDSAAVIAVDVRFDGDNWSELRPLISRLLRSYRSQVTGTERLEVPTSAEGALALLTSFSGLDFEDDVRPALDGHLVVGISQDADEQPPRVVAAYRTEDGDLRRIAEAAADGAKLDELKGFDDVVLLDESIALVGDDTLLFADGPADPLPLLRGALQRAADDDGFDPAPLERAERDTGMEDPVVLGTGSLALAGRTFDAVQLERVLEASPYLAAIEEVALSVDASEDDGLTAVLRAATDPTAIEDDDLPVGPAGTLSLPEDERLIIGGSRDQSLTTTFLSRVARAAYADSRFAKAVDEAEKDLGISFEDEVLRQFDCPSISLLEPPGQSTVRFAARSCVRDPERMRALLPRLQKHLPAIVTGLQGLGDRGLAALLLIAPDAPLTPSFLGGLAQIVVRPFGGEDQEAPREELYELAGLHDGPDNTLVRSGPDKVVFGMIGDAFVVASDADMARDIATRETRALGDEAAAAVEVPLGVLFPFDGDVREAFTAVFPDLSASISATRSETTVRAHLRPADD